MDHNIIIDAAWLPEQDDTVGTTETAWARTFLDALQPHRAGVYVNFLQRLAEVKAKHDPENMFHNNKNIQPATPAQ